MSNTIDQRVVEMQFDNRQFEAGVQTSLSTLERLKQGLRLPGATKGLEDVNTAANKVSFAGLLNGVEAVQVKFSYLQASIQHQLNRIVDSAISTGKRMVSALTIDPIKTGFTEYETQINAVQTILANTKSKGTTIDDVNGALDELNTYADKTIYNFTEMTRNIGTFTAAGVDLDKSVTSIKGIANLAAVSGSTSQQASTAMYQLSQALAAGKVQLMDWNSVVNAGMGGQVFQDALKRTAKHMGTNVDAMIKKYGSFRESLTQGEWLTAEVLTETLTQLSGAYTEADLLNQGYTKEQAKEILELAKTAEDAATKVKTFTQLWDTLKESAQSGWTQTWEIIVGDFEEAKTLLTKVSDTIGGMIGEAANARNEMLQGWKDMGGRTVLIEALTNVFTALMNIMTPIKEAFREIFPPITAKQLYNFTMDFAVFTKKLILSEEQMEKLKDLFKGLFSIIDIGVSFIKDLAGGLISLLGNFKGLGGGILDVGESFGEWASSLRDSVKESDFFGKAIDKIVDILSNAIGAIKNFAGSISSYFGAIEFEGFLGIFEGIWNFIKLIGKRIIDAFGAIGEGLANATGEAGFFNVLNSGLFAGILVGFNKFVNGLSDPFEGVSGLFEGLKDTLESVRGCFEAYQQSLQADTLMKIAKAIGLLAAAILVLSIVDENALNRSLGAITILFADLMGSLMLFEKMGVGLKGAAKAMGMMVSMSVAILILAAALKVISTLDTEQLTRGLIAVGGLMAGLSVFMSQTEFDKKTGNAAKGIVLISAAIWILSKAVGVFGGMDTEQLTKGLIAVGALLGGLSIFTNYTNDAKGMVSAGLGMVLLGAAMKIFADATRDFASMSWEHIIRGLGGMAGALLSISLAMKIMPKNLMSSGIGMVVIAGAMVILAKAFTEFASLDTEQLGVGLLAIGGALLELAIGLHMMSGSAGGALALIIAAGALAILAPVMQSLGGLSWEEIGKGLVAIAGAFAVVGVAGLLLAPLVPTLLGLAAAFALFGIAALGIGAGLALIGVGLTAVSGGITTLGVAITAGATAIVAGLSVIIMGVINLLPEIIEGLGGVIIALCAVIKECAPDIADTVLVVVSDILSSLALYTPQIIDSLMTFLIGLLDGLSSRMPELITAAMNLIGSFFQGVTNALSGIDSSSLLKGVVGVGLMTGLMYALSGVVALIPGAITGVLGMGAVIAELAIVLAAIGALAQIPGLEWLISEGGRLLQTMGNAIGQFFGGIVGGIGEGISSSLPQIGTDLSAFMTNAQPFIEGAKAIDPAMMDGVKALAETILILTAADILDGITSWITGGSSIASFGEELVPFGEAMKEYSEAIVGMDADTVAKSANAAKALAEFADTIPNEGGWLAKVTGDNSIADFAEELVPFGEAMKEYSDAIAGLDADLVTKSATAAKALTDFANTVPNEGGWLSKITGDNSLSAFAEELVPFGTALTEYSGAVTGLDSGAIYNSVGTAKSLLSFVSGLDNFTATGVENFKAAITTLGTVSVDKFISAFSQSASQAQEAGAKMMTSVVTGIMSKESAVTTAMKTVLMNLSKAVITQYSNYKEVGVQLVEHVGMGVRSQQEKFSFVMITVMAGVVKSIRDYQIVFYNAGSYVVSGFANGITANTYKAEASSRAMAIAALDAAKEALGVQSPSKEFYAVGEFSGMGLVNALFDYARNAYNAGAEVGDSAISGVSEAVSRIKYALDNEVDVQPTITPVLDLSNIKSGANAINGLLDGTPLTANIGSISTMMNRRTQNGTTDDVVYAINKLRKDLSELDRNSYNIGNVSYEEGSDVANAIQTLVRAAVRERRV